MNDHAPPSLNLSDWPQPSRPYSPCPKTESFIDRILNGLRPEEKIGQIIQADIGSVTPDDVAKYNLGAVLNGGNSAPNGNQRAGLANWLELADAFWCASMREDGPHIPVLWGTDAVHGHNNLIGATIFPHNINLGAAHDPVLAEQIGVATAREIRTSGMDWTFAPSVAVARDLRWGRTYEAYSESPDLVAELGAALVRGLQGLPGNADFLGDEKVIATAKHFIGDGGTRDGRDQGETIATEQDMRLIHAAGYHSALEAGVLTVMASFSSWGGRKMHGHKALLTDLLKTHWAFDGVIVGDWDGHGQIPGATPTDCPEALMAGLDMYMAPGSWKGLHGSLMRHLKSGRITENRLDDAVRRILRLKARAGLWDQPMPSKRSASADKATLGCADHVALAAEAAVKSAVLLKNSNQVLPLSPIQRVLVTGVGADDLGMACGGWTLSWQGGSLTKRDYPHAETLLEGIQRVVCANGGAVEYAPDGHFSIRPDIAIHVTGETPYAEFRGDISSLEFQPPMRNEMDMLARLNQANIPIVTVFLSGRPLWVNPLLNASDAFIAAFLPGTQSGTLADILFVQESSVQDFTGKLPFAWPAYASQPEGATGNSPPPPLFPFGFGLTLHENGDLAPLHESRLTIRPDHGVIFDQGMNGGSWTLQLGETEPACPWRGGDRMDQTRALTAKTADLGQQENAICFEWEDTQDLHATFSHAPLDLTRESNAGFCLTLVYDAEQSGQTLFLTVLSHVGVTCIGALSSFTPRITDNGPVTIELPLQELAMRGVDLTHVEGIRFSASAPTRFTLSFMALTMPQG